MEDSKIFQWKEKNKLQWFNLLLVFVYICLEISEGKAGNDSVQPFISWEITAFKIMPQPFLYGWGVHWGFLFFLSFYKSCRRICTLFTVLLETWMATALSRVQKCCGCPGRHSPDGNLCTIWTSLQWDFVWQQQIFRLEESLERCFICYTYLKILWRVQEES